MKIVEVMYFVPAGQGRYGREFAAQWYSQFFEAEVSRSAEDTDFFLLRVGGVEVVFHPADDKGPSGVAGQVVYWQVEQLDAALDRALRLGAQLYRGPLLRTDGLWMCQVRDPFGNAIGLIGPRQQPK